MLEVVFSQSAHQRKIQYRRHIHDPFIQILVPTHVTITSLAYCVWSSQSFARDWGDLFVECRRFKTVKNFCFTDTFLNPRVSVIFMYKLIEREREGDLYCSTKTRMRTYFEDFILTTGNVTFYTCQTDGYRWIKRENFRFVKYLKCSIKKWNVQIKTNGVYGTSCL